MIHEATFSDDLHENAVQNLHSTQREAVELGMKAEAEVIVLTHFSQRYAKSAGNVKVDEAKLLQKKE
jgi:ribonuclease Z